MALTICNCILKINDEFGNAFSAAELVFELRKSQVNLSDAVYLIRPARNRASPGIVIQDLTYIAIDPEVTPAITVAYTGGGTAGAEVVTVVGNAISVQIQSGVSTATNIKTAVIASVPASTLVYTILSGTGSNTQTTVSATALDDSYCYLPLAETTTSSQLGVFTLSWDDSAKTSGQVIFDPVLIPNQSFLDLSTLITVVRG